jgi:colanic acid/amylovoran biosynthesis glycosyltransferase
MKLLFLNNVFPELSQTFVASQIAQAIAAGHEVEVVAVRSPRDAAVISRAREALPQVRYALPVSAPAVGRLGAWAARRPVKLPSSLRFLLTGKIGRVDLLTAALISDSPDAIIANFGENGIRAARLKRLLFPQARLCVLFHGQDMSAFVARHGWGPYREVAVAIDLPLGVNARWVELLRTQAGMPHAKLHHVGVQLDHVRPWKGGAPGPFSILFVGRLVEKKGLEYLVRAAALLKEQGRDLRLDVIGDGPLRAAAEALSAALGVEADIRFHGDTPHETVLQAMQESHCLVVPSVTAGTGDAEGIPVALMEGMASGMPVVATRHSGIPEVVSDGVTGLLVPERDPRALAAAIRRIMDDPQGAKDMGVRARAHMHKDFDASRQNATLLAELEALVARSADRD